ncbi:hypothetical protein C8R42DRAFT_697664 [Lentinula raphanica]|nr:hypothetical protein C8R42DRAFT_697664 [Lentinula raphanica]
MAFLPRPQGAGWDEVVAKVDERLQHLYAHAKISAGSDSHRRGIGFGGGRTEPGNYANSPHNAKLIEDLLADPAFKSVASFVDAGLSTLFPKLHCFLTNLLQNILDDNPLLQRLFDECCYAALHFNLQFAWTDNHVDYFNVLFAMCCAFCVGNFDHTRGGHLIAWEFGVVAEFPPGSAIFLPSAWVTHANVPIATHERRSSLAFFTSSGLARWYQNGYMSDKSFQDLAIHSQLKTWKDARNRLWETGVDMLIQDE